ncbi:hypothetical protein GCM10022393_15710 [Aquimarina addita]|uniref:Uncharacterized protein n=1 Tax=Aquimarina addita TaxID=870485 RepID=A0ABP7XGC0_9FLAO
MYYLILITSSSVLLALIFKRLPDLSNKISQSFSWVIQKPIVRVVIFIIFNSAIYFVLGIDQIKTSFSIIPDVDTFIFYSFFYIVGWILFKSKHLLQCIVRLDWVSVILGFILFLTCIMLSEVLSSEIKIIISSLFTWLLIFWNYSDIY